MNVTTLSVKQFCTSVGISRANFYNILKSGTGPATIKLGRRTLISVTAAEDWLKHMERLTTAARAEAAK